MTDTTPLPIAVPVYEKNGQQAPHEPTEPIRGLVERLARIGTRQSDIAEVIGLDPKTLRKHYRAGLDHGALIANATVAESLYRKAISNDHPASVTAAIFWLKTRGGWTEKAEERTNELATVMAEYTRLFGQGPILDCGAKKQAGLLEELEM